MEESDNDKVSILQMNKNCPYCGHTTSVVTMLTNWKNKIKEEAFTAGFEAAKKKAIELAWDIWRGAEINEPAKEELYGEFAEKFEKCISNISEDLADKAPAIKEE